MTSMEEDLDFNPADRVEILKILNILYKQACESCVESQNGRCLCRNSKCEENSQTSMCCDCRASFTLNERSINAISNARSYKPYSIALSSNLILCPMCGFANKYFRRIGLMEENESFECMVNRILGMKPHEMSTYLI